jgi:hypothetical protein
MATVGLPDNFSLPVARAIIGFNLPFNNAIRFSRLSRRVQSASRSSVTAVPSARTIRPSSPQSNFSLPAKLLLSSALRMLAAISSTGLFPFCSAKTLTEPAKTANHIVASI